MYINLKYQYFFHLHFLILCRFDKNVHVIQGFPINFHLILKFFSKIVTNFDVVILSKIFLSDKII